MKPSKKRLAVIDVGSHSIHLEIFKLQRNNGPLSIYKKSLLSYLGQAVALTGKIPSAERRHLKATLLQLLRKAKKKKTKSILIVATSGFRKALNGKLVIEELSKAAKCRIHLLTTDRESELGFLGIRSELKPHAVQLFLDCGGGSTEISIAKGQNRKNHRTFPVGSETLSLQIKNNPPQVEDLLHLSKSLAAYDSVLPESPRPVRALASGSSIKTLLDLIPQGMPNTLELEHINIAAMKLLQKRSKKITAKYGIQKECIPALVPAALLLTMILDHYKIDKAVISNKGLRDGVAQDYVKHPSHWS